jgi:hypothetical protein
LRGKEILHKKVPTETSITPVFSPGFFLPFIKKKINLNILSEEKKVDFWGMKLSGFKPFFSARK